MKRIAGLAAFVIAAGTSAQIQPLEEFAVGVAVESGAVVNPLRTRAVIYDTVIQVPAAAWLRLTFDNATLGAAPAGGVPTVLRMTALYDGGTQTHTAETLSQWQHTSAYFNGATVRLQIEADPGAAPSRVAMSTVLIGPVEPDDPATDTICGPTDDRLPSEDARAGRLMPIGCTGWLINDANTCMLTAGHCTGSGAQVMQFNVPLSSSSGAPQNPGPEDQYALDLASMQTNGGAGIGNDWAYFGCFPNTETGLTAGEAQGDAYVLAMPPAVSGQDIRITGYGSTGGGVPPQWNLAQKTHVGAYTLLAGSAVSYATDTTGGNSGSPVIDESTGFAIGIHTHGGCGSAGGQNNGTGANNGGLQAALANPQGVCVPSALLAFTYPDGLPPLLDPAGATVRVEVSAIEGGGVPAPGTGMLHVDAGDGPVSMPMDEVMANVYDAVFPALPCGQIISYSFSAETSTGDATSDPVLGAYTALAGVTELVVFADDFEADLGWTVEDVAIEDGSWTRGVPAGAGDRQDPTTDFDGSGQAWLTDNTPGNSDVDGGPTRLISPPLDLSGLDDPFIEYARWFRNDDQDIDRLDVHVAAAAAGPWKLVESVPDTPGWQKSGFLVRDFVVPTSTVYVRFSATDNPNNSVTEAGIDAVRVLDLQCGDLPGDLDGDGDVDFQDLVGLLATWGDCPGCPADLDGDGDVGFGDLLTLLASWSV